MTVSFYLKRPKADVETSIFAIIFWHGHRLKYYTTEKILPKYWNKDAQRAKQTEKFKQYPEFNRRLENLSTQIGNIYRTWVNDNYGTIPNAETLKTLLDKELISVEPTKEMDKTLFGFFDDLIKQTENGARLQPKSGKPYSKATIHVYKNTLNRLKEFAAHTRRKIDFDTITVDFYTDFTGYLTKRLKLASNTIGKDIKTLKTVLNEATERGLNTNIQYKSRKFSVTSENTDAIYLTLPELQQLEDLDLSGNKRLDNVRDLFLIGCYTGLRFSDWTSIKPEQINDGFIEITQAKTGGEIVLPIHPTVKKIFDKYEGRLPKTISNQKLNEYLKELGQVRPEGKDEPVLNASVSKTLTKGGVKVITNYKKWELLSSHTARRSFATNEYLQGTPTLTIMAITGHKTEKAFLRYIKLTPNEHAKLLKQHWQQRSQLKAV